MAEVVKIISTALVDHFKEIDEVRARLNELKGMRKPMYAFSDDDDVYQEQLELKWEIEEVEYGLKDLERKTAKIAAMLNVDISDEQA